MRPQAIKLNKLVRAGHKEIFIIIDSGGGSLQAGSILVDRIKAAKYRGVTVNCIVDGMAASMALILMSHCSERYGMFGSYIMWHSAAYGGLMNINDRAATKLLEELAMINDTIWSETRVYFWPWYFREHYKNETLLPVTEIERNSFGFLKVLNRIIIVKPDNKTKVEVKPIKSGVNPAKEKVKGKQHYKRPVLSPLQRGY